MAHWRDRLAYSCSVGGTHWEGLGGGKGLPGPRPVLFFAPAQAKKRVADWGADGFQERLAAAWYGLPRARARSGAALAAGRRGTRAGKRSSRPIRRLLDGKVPANEGRILAV